MGFSLPFSSLPTQPTKVTERASGSTHCFERKMERKIQHPNRIIKFRRKKRWNLCNTSRVLGGTSSNVLGLVLLHNLSVAAREKAREIHQLKLKKTKKKTKKNDFYMERWDSPARMAELASRPYLELIIKSELIEIKSKIQNSNIKLN